MKPETKIAVGAVLRLDATVSAEERRRVLGALNGRTRWLTTGEAARRLGVSQRSIVRWAERGLIEAKRAGKAWRVSEECAGIGDPTSRGRFEGQAADGEGDGILAVGPGGLAGCADRNNNRAA